MNHLFLTCSPRILPYRSIVFQTYKLLLVLLCQYDTVQIAKAPPPNHTYAYFFSSYLEGSSAVGHNKETRQYPESPPRICL